MADVLFDELIRDAKQPGAHKALNRLAKLLRPIADRIIRARRPAGIGIDRPSDIVNSVMTSVINQHENWTAEHFGQLVRLIEKKAEFRILDKERREGAQRRSPANGFVALDELTEPASAQIVSASELEQDAEALRRMEILKQDVLHLPPAQRDAMLVFLQGRPFADDKVRWNFNNAVRTLKERYPEWFE